MDRIMAVVGYARVSTEDQSTEGQILDLQKFGCTEIFRENASGADRDRPQLKAVLGRVRKGDTLVVVRIDRLARSLSHLLSVIETLDRRGVAFKSLGDPIDTGSPQGKFTLQILGAVAEFERSLIQERTRSGVRIAKAMGKKPGNPGLMAGDPMAKRRVARARDERLSDRVIAGADQFLPIVQRLRPDHPWDRVVDVLNGAMKPRPGDNPSEWTRDALIRAVRRLVADGLADASLLKAAPRRSRKAVAQTTRLVELVATIHNAADGDKPTLARIGRQLERQGVRTATGAKTWAPSSVKALLDRVREQGLITPETRPTTDTNARKF
jgi:DNA invertase Pin-like site-specific DNA recombinase